jgi:hypothetical protein
MPALHQRKISPCDTPVKTSHIMMTPPNWTIIFALPMHRCRIHFHSCNCFRKRKGKGKTAICLRSLYLKLMDLCDSKLIWGTMVPSIGIWGLCCYTIVTSYPFLNWQLRAAPPIPIIWASNTTANLTSKMGRLPTISHAPPINMKLGLSKVQTTNSKPPG